MATEYEGPGGGTAERGLYDCRSLPLAGSVEAYDAAWVATECFSAESGEWVTYDTVEGAQVKARYIVQERLGGAMYWELAFVVLSTGIGFSNANAKTIQRRSRRSFR